MMKATLMGKPDAGNLHVRIDEGQVASTKPGRGFLRHNGIVAVIVAGLALPCSASLSSRSYVQDGLIGQWDGVEKSGRGVQSAGTTWKDLVGSADIAIPASASFSDEGLTTVRASGTLVGGSTTASTTASLRDAFRAALYTAEVAFNKTKVTEKSSVGNQSAICMLLSLGWDNNPLGTYLDGKMGFSPVGAANGYSTSKNVEVSSTLGQHTLSCSQTPSNYNIRVDRTITGSGDLTPGTQPYNHGFRFNCGYYQDCGLDGIYYSMRVYNRVLTTDEVVVNQAVDQIRFFGADPSGIELPSGWRFNTKDGVVLERAIEVRASVAAGGTVRVDDGESGATAQVWSDKEQMSAVVQLTAMPADGYRFVRWSGGIVEKTPYAAVGTYTVTGTVTAVFLKTDGASLSAKSYIQKGLIGQWDGVENNGFGSHSESVTSWKDLVGIANIALPTAASFDAIGVNTLRANGTLVGGWAGDDSTAALRTAFKNALYTAEVAYNKTNATPKSTLGNKTAICMMLSLGWDNTPLGTYADTHIGFSPVGSASGTSVSAFVDVPTTCGDHTLSCSQTPSNYNIRVDRTITGSGALTPGTQPYNHGFRFNCGYYQDCGLDGIYYSMRVYNRVLTADEVVVNQAVDQIRFFGADPSGIELPSGWRFNTKDGIALQQAKQASSSDPRKGSVSIAGSSASSIVTFWINHDLPTEITVSAIPKPGCKFSRWTGDIVSGDLKSANGVLSVTGDICAVFRDCGLVVIVR